MAEGRGLGPHPLRDDSLSGRSWHPRQLTFHGAASLTRTGISDLGNLRRLPLTIATLEPSDGYDPSTGPYHGPVFPLALRRHRAPGEIQTPVLLVRSETLYSLGYWCMAVLRNFEIPAS